MPSLVAEISGYNFTDAEEQTLRFSFDRGIAFTDAYCYGDLLYFGGATQKIGHNDQGEVVLSADSGRLVVANMPRHLNETGPWDDLLTWAFQGRVASLYEVEGTDWAGRVLRLRGVLEQPTADLSAGADGASKITWQIRDPRSALIAPLQTRKFLGTNSGGSGTEGTPDQKGQPLPVLYGVVSNIPGVRCNTEKMIWCLADKAATVLCARDGGGPYTAGTARANLASLEANVPLPGRYDYVSGAQGTYVRLGSPNAKTVTFDAEEGANSAARTHAQIWKRVREDRCYTDGADLEIGDTDTDVPNEVGWWWADGRNQREALDEILASLSGYEYQDPDGVWHLRRLKKAAGTAEIDFVLLQEDTELADTDRPLLDNIIVVRPPYTQNGARPYRVNELWGKNYTLMRSTDFLDAVAADPDNHRLIEKFGLEWRTETADDDAIWDPVANTGAYPNAPELTIRTGHQPGVDGVSAPHVAADALTLLELFDGTPHYQVRYVPEAGDALVLGSIVSLRMHRFNLADGRLFLVTQHAMVAEANKLIATAVIGYQGDVP